MDFGLILALLWGFAIALFMRAWAFGRWLALNMMWFIVACGAGIDLLIISHYYTVGGFVRWLDVVYVFFWSSLAIAGWSLYDLGRRAEGVVNERLGED